MSCVPQAVLDRLAGQLSNSTARRDRFTVTRAELLGLLTMRDTRSGFPRDVVISPSFGSGIASWFSDSMEGRSYELVEDPVTVQAAKDGVNAADLVLRLVESGRWTRDELSKNYWGGWRNLEVVTVNGPYKIDEYDGSESIVERSDGEVWRS